VGERGREKSHLGRTGGRKGSVLIRKNKKKLQKVERGSSKRT